MRRKVVFGLGLIVILTLAGCGSVANRQQNNAEQLAFGKTGQTARSQVWYIAQNTGQPSAQLALRAVTITQNGQATSFQVPASFTLASASKLSAAQLRDKGPVLAKQVFRQQQRELISALKGHLAEEKDNLKKDRDATVVSFAAVKMDRRIVARYQQALARIEETKFKQPRPLPFSVAVEKRKGRVSREKIQATGYDFVGTAANPQTLRYQKVDNQIFTSPYPQASSAAVKLGKHYFGYYYSDSEYVLTKVAGPNANVTFDTSAVRR